jgi:hypothetical protein
MTTRAGSDPPSAPDRPFDYAVVRVLADARRLKDS